MTSRVYKCHRPNGYIYIYNSASVAQMFTFSRRKTVMRNGSLQEERRQTLTSCPKAAKVYIFDCQEERQCNADAPFLAEWVF